MATLGVKEILLCCGSGIWLWLMILQVQHTWNKVSSNHFYLGHELSPDKPTVYWVNWLRAKAWYDWWSEEHILILNKMNWTWLCFINKAKDWTQLRDLVLNKPGHVCFAEGQINMWKELCFQVTKAFINASVMCEAITLPNHSWISFNLYPPSCLQHNCHPCPSNQSISFRTCRQWQKDCLQERAMTTLPISCGRMRRSSRKYCTTGHPGSGPYTWPSFQNTLRPSLSYHGNSIMEPNWWALFGWVSSTNLIALWRASWLLLLAWLWLTGMM